MSKPDVDDIVFKVKGLVLPTAYGRLPVSHLFDIYGGDTTDLAEACRCVAMLPSGNWGVFDVEPGEIEKAEEAAN